MGPTWGEQVVAATTAAVEALTPLTGRGWEQRAGGLEWTCRATAVHLASDLVKYAAQLAGRVDHSYLRFAVTVPDEEPPAELVRTIEGCGHVLASVVDAAPTGATAWHWGPTDASGYAAMGVGELLLHTSDIAGGLGDGWCPPAPLAAAVVTRLLRDASVIDDPVAALLWSTGRADLPGLPHVDAWVWRAAVR